MALLRRKNNPEARMSLGEHFKEFRNRATIAFIAILIAGIVGWLRYDHIWQWLQEPINTVARERNNPDVKLNMGGAITDPFSIKFKVALWVGIILASPVWLWEIWAFLAPGLTRKEKRTGLGFLAAAVPLFLVGCWASTFALPNAVKFLLGVTPEGVANFQDGQTYLTFVTKFILAFGFAFLVPVFLVALNAAHVFPGHIMLKGWRVAVMAIGVFAAAMSPSPDVWSMLVLMGPMIALYFAACGISLFMDKRRDSGRPEWLDVPDDERSSL